MVQNNESHNLKPTLTRKIAKVVVQRVLSSRISSKLLLLIKAERKRHNSSCDIEKKDVKTMRSRRSARKFSQLLETPTEITETAYGHY